MLILSDLGCRGSVITNLICVFVFAYAKRWFSLAAAQITVSKAGLYKKYKLQESIGIDSEIDTKYVYDYLSFFILFLMYPIFAINDSFFVNVANSFI